MALGCQEGHCGVRSCAACSHGATLLVRLPCSSKSRGMGTGYVRAQKWAASNLQQQHHVVPMGLVLASVSEAFTMYHCMPCRSEGRLPHPLKFASRNCVCPCAGIYTGMATVRWLHMTYTNYNWQGWSELRGVKQRASRCVCLCAPGGGGRWQAHSRNSVAAGLVPGNGVVKHGHLS